MQAAVLGMDLGQSGAILNSTRLTQEKIRANARIASSVIGAGSVLGAAELQKQGMIRAAKARRPNVQTINNGNVIGILANGGNANSSSSSSSTSSAAATGGAGGCVGNCGGNPINDGDSFPDEIISVDDGSVIPGSVIDGDSLPN